MSERAERVTQSAAEFQHKTWTGVHILRDLCRRNGLSQQAIDDIANLFLFHTREHRRECLEWAELELRPAETTSDDDEEGKSSDSDSN